MPMKEFKYGDDFYSDRDSLTRTSAEVVVRMLLDLFRPESVVDLGCGVGTWLSTFERMGCREIVGFDGAYVNKELLEIPPECFRPTDLSSPIRIERKFDLAMSLEVAEHLDSQYAQQFVGSLTQFAPVVLFSAAIPFQGGLHHVNEQWPDYWSDIFKAQGFVCIDALRSRLWNCRNVLYWYRQNILLFVSESYLAQQPALKVLYELHGGTPRALIHPEAYLLKCTAPPSVRSAAFNALRTARNAIRHKFSHGIASKSEAGE